MTMRRVYQVGGRLSAVHHLFSEKEEHGGTKDRDVRNLYRSLDRGLANVAVVSDGSDTPPSEELKQSDGYFLASIMLGILMRGPVSLLSTEAERELLSSNDSPSSQLLEAESPDSRFVGEQHDFNALRESLILRLCHKPSGATTSWADAEDSYSEPRFRDKGLPTFLGPLSRLIEHQRPIASMLDMATPGMRRFASSRVDFALEIGSLKYVFEVDGPHHRQQDHADDDRARDAALGHAGWTVFRFPVGSGRWGLDEQALTQVESRLDGNAAIRAMRSMAGPSSEPMAALLTTIPHAIARIQLCVLLAMIDGTLRLDAEQWSIAIVERETEASLTAFIDLRRYLLTLGHLYGIHTIPTIVLRRIEPKEGNGREESFEGIETYGGPWDPALDSLQQFDLVLDVAVHARERDRFAQPLPLVGRRTLEVRTAYHSEIEPVLAWSAPRKVDLEREAAVTCYLHFLRMIFRKPDFRPNQVEAIHRAMQRKDVVALMPTGGGKSITFQLPTFLSPGHTIVVVPIRSLMDDQVQNLRSAGIRGGQALHSGLGDLQHAALDRVVRGNARLIYLSPERFHIRTFLNAFSQSDVSRNVAFVAFDEAHCVSEWGHDFRPAYLRIAERIRKECNAAPFLALTGTASEIVLTDTIRELAIFEADDPVVAAREFSRPELEFYPINVAGKKSGRLQEAMRLIRARVDPEGEMNLPANNEVGGLVFCPYVNNEFGVVGVRTAMMDAFGLTPREVRLFAGAMPKNYEGRREDWDQEKAKNQSDFKANRYPIIACTKAFGMGIDKPNIRYTIHWGIPGSIEALAQEAGRAGRGKDASACVILYNKEEAAPGAGFLDATTSEDARARYKAIKYDHQQDAGRIMYLHGLSYPGEKEDAQPMLEMLETIQHAQQHQLVLGNTIPVSVPRPSIGDDDNAANSIEKAVYRLSILGVIADYTMQYGGRSAVHLETHLVDANKMRKAFVEYVGRYRTDREVQDDRLREKVGESIEERASRYLRRFGPELNTESVVRAFCAFVYDRIEGQRREALRNIVRIFNEADGQPNHISSEIENHLSRSTYSGLLRELRSDLDPAAPDAWWRLVDDAVSNGLEGRLAGAATRALESEPDRVGYRVIAATMRLTRDSPNYSLIAGQLVEALGNTPGTTGEDRQRRVESLADSIMQRIVASQPARSDDVIRAIVARGDSDVLIRAAYLHATDPDLKKLCAMPWIREFASKSRSYVHASLGVAE